eukprot:CAMPEP_0204287542 /NCGR_PEP_ID=MMETSP0468-20130131/54984_1 /ASSEMBLY_ACC=CAM_ASM_000383 /TAXON_ID=2969 /ORGANISM="Oxyrrhis marina" /LENGTH=229 /DNA_ID=CAMNT_0051265541 /DNA_START=640 /DNA_END=1330 /DNA_ORIENTATION=+
MGPGAGGNTCPRATLTLDAFAGASLASSNPINFFHSGGAAAPPVEGAPEQGAPTWVGPGLGATCQPAMKTEQPQGQQQGPGSGPYAAGRLGRPSWSGRVGNHQPTQTACGAALQHLRAPHFRLLGQPSVPPPPEADTQISAPTWVPQKGTLQQETRTGGQEVASRPAHSNLAGAPLLDCGRGWQMGKAWCPRHLVHPLQAHGGQPNRLGPEPADCQAGPFPLVPSFSGG